MEQQLYIQNKAPKSFREPQTIEEAIIVDQEKMYIPIDGDTFKAASVGTKNLVFRGYSIPMAIQRKIAEYRPRTTSDLPRIITLDDEVIGVVSPKFQPIGVADIIKNASDVFGSHVSEKAANHSIIVTYDSQYTTDQYAGRDVRGISEHTISPVLRIPNNFGDCAFSIAFQVFVLTCKNGAHFTPDVGKGSRFVHNIYALKNFELKDVFNRSLAQIAPMEQVLLKSQQLALPPGDLPVLFFEAGKGTQEHIHNMFLQHFEHPTETLWDAVMHITYVSSHQVDNANVSQSMSEFGGDSLRDLVASPNSLKKSQYYKALAWYQERLELAQDPFWGSVDLEPLKAIVRAKTI